MEDLSQCQQSNRDDNNIDAIEKPRLVKSKP